MPGAVAALEQAAVLHRIGGEVAMDEARAMRPHEPRLELREIGVVATADMVEEGHEAGR